MSDSIFAYFNPVTFFEQNPAAEDFLYKVPLRKTKKEAFLSFLNSASPISGQELLRDFFSDSKAESFGAYSTTRLINSQAASTAQKKDDQTRNEKECLSFVISCIEAQIRDIKSHMGADPTRNNYGADPDLRSDWLAECADWQDKKARIKQLQKLSECPYSFHLVLKDGKNIFINEDQEFQMIHFAWDYPVLTNKLGEMNRLVSRIFSESDENLAYIRLPSKTTYGNVPIQVKRSVQIHNGMLIKTKDERLGTVDDAGSPTTDPFLQDVLYKRRGDPGIDDIIQTIQKNQLEILARPFDENLFVQGVAGSGKTMVLLQRISDLVSLNKSIDPQKVIFVEPNSGFDSYFNSYFEERRLTKVNRNTMAGYLVSLIGRYYIKIAKQSYRLGKEEGREIPKRVDAAFINKKDYEAKWQKAVCLDKDCDESLRRLIYGPGFLSMCQEVKTQHQEKKIKVEQKVFSASKRAYVDYSMQYTDVDDFPRLIREFLLQIKKSCGSESIKIPDISQDLFTESKQITRLDSVGPKTIPTCLAYAIVRMLYIKYGPLEAADNDNLIAIDECQDYHFRVYETLNLVEPKTVFNLFGDLKQDLGFHGPEWDKNQGIAAQIERHVSYKFRKYALLENYRNSDEILKYCKKEFKVEDKGYGASTMDPIKIDLKRLISLLSFHSFLNDRSAIIFAKRYESAIFAYLKPLFERYGLEDVALLTPVEAKGMEFDNVFIAGYGFMSFSERYVACSRALNELYILQTKELNEDVTN